MNAPAILLLNLANKRLITLASGNRISAYLSEADESARHATDRVANIR
jgi:hypothetical protein